MQMRLRRGVLAIMLLAALSVWPSGSGVWPGVGSALGLRPVSAATCGVVGAPACVRLDARELCYNLYRGGTAPEVDYFPCYEAFEECVEGTVSVGGVCAKPAAARGIQCCNDVVVAGKKLGFIALVDLTKAAPVVPGKISGFNYCDWDPTGRHDQTSVLEGWMEQPDYWSILSVNANFYDAQQVHPNPHLSPCTTVYGPLIANGAIVAGGGDVAIGKTTAYTLAFYTAQHAVQAGRQADILKTTALPGSRFLAQIVSSGVTGVLLVENGAYNQELDKSEFKPDKTVPRVAVGLTADGNSLYVLAVQTGDNTQGLTMRDLAAYMIAHTHSDIALALDGGGSTTFRYQQTPTSAVTITPPSDVLPGLSKITGEKYYRKVPVFLGFR